MENNENIEFMEGKRLNEIKCARFLKDVLGLAYEDKTFFSTQGRYRSEDELRQQRPQATDLPKSPRSC